MTIKVTIEHAAPDTKFDIEVYQVRTDVAREEITFSKTPSTRLSPGKKADFYVWPGNDLLIKEVL